MVNIKRIGGSFFILVFFVQYVLANGDRIKALEDKVDILAEELESIKPGGNASFFENIRFHGYGELHYNNTSKPGENDTMDFHRMVIGLEYSFNNWIVFNTEVDFEHAASEMELEYAYVSFLLSDAFSIRVGDILMPVGYLNEYHEPINFYSVERPYVQKYIIPTTWQEGGAGIFGSMGDFKYRLYLVGGLDASKFRASSGIRKGRGKVAEALSNDLGIVGRAEYKFMPYTWLGISGYTGDAAQNRSDLGDATVSIGEMDIRYRLSNIELTGLFAYINIEDTDKINVVTGQTIGKDMLGWYIEGAYHLDMPLPEDQDIVLFARHEQFDTQNSVDSGFSRDPSNERRVTTFGISYYPMHQIAIKGDLELWDDASGKDWEQFNIGVAFEY